MRTPNHMDKEVLRDIYAKAMKMLRKNKRETQQTFWNRFGITQSRSSRFEKGVGIPLSVAILIELYLEKKVNDADLLTALNRVLMEWTPSFKRHRRAKMGVHPPK